MNYLSVCSGIEAATVGWHSLGWQPVAFSEIEKFPCSALAHHYPDVPNWGDMTKFKEWPDANVNVLVGGTPCQSFSVAGLRKGLADPRGNLMLTYLAIAAKYSPEWLVWENVPGVLSSNGGRDFASLLRGMGQLGYGFAYRILDAQYFGVPQRRRRVFVVGCAGGWQRAAAVLFERHSLQRHTAPRREAGKGFTHSVAPSLTSSGRGVERGGDTRGQDPVIACDVAGALDTQCGGGKLTHQSVVNGHVLPVMGTLTTRTFTALGARDIEEGALVPMISHSLRGEGFDASEDGTGRGTPLVPVAYSILGNAIGRQDHNGQNGHCISEEVAPTLDKTAVHAVATTFRAKASFDLGVEIDVSGTLEAVNPTAVVAAFKGNQGSAAGSIGYSEHVALTLSSSTPTLMQTMQVRRLTPRECERLQGFPDDYTLVPHNGKTAADGPRYKALGNSMAVPVMAWIGKRIQQVEEITCTTKQKYLSA
jgi:DNA (cytosine-5)-methyltransferase 1